ncbi:MAG: ParA family protein [Rickettsiaceae bacterium]
MTKIISVVAQKGGTGKTTTVLELAYQLSIIKNYTIVVIDLDGLATATKQLTGHKNHKSGIYDTIVYSTLIEKTLVPAHDFWKNTLVSPGDMRLDDCDEKIQKTLIAKEQILNRAISNLVNKVDFILIDTPGELKERAVNALVASTHYLLPICPSEYGADAVSNVQYIANQIKTSVNPKLEFMGILMTRVNSNSSNDLKDLIARIKVNHGDELISTKVPFSNTIIGAQKQQRPMSSLKNNAIGRAYKRVAEIIL